MDETSDRFRVLFVCTGNICRSPVAEQVARERFGVFGVDTSSAGTRAIDGDIMPPQAEGIARGLGADPSRHRAERLNRAQIERADLVIALAREHRSAIVREVPRASRYTFTLLEFARVLDNFATGKDSVDSMLDPSSRGAFAGEPVSLVERIRSFVPAIAARRGFADQPDRPEDDDVTDPYGRAQQVYDLSGAQIADAFDRIGESVRIISAARGGGRVSARLP